MLITTATQLEALRAKVREVIIDSTDDALALLAEALPAGRAKHNQVLVLTSRASDVANHDIGNTLPTHLLDVLRNELRSDVLTFTDHLRLADFGDEAPARPELKPGHLLYKVPPKMALRETYECLIRIAHQLNDVLEGIELDDSVALEELPVAEVMEVEVIDPSPAGNPAFDILLLSDGEQLVDEFSATDWVFNIRPLRTGEHRLVLKISVLITVEGKERTKNIVLQRPISVTAEVMEVGTAEFVRADSFVPPTLEPSSEGSSPPPPPPAPSPPQVPRELETVTEPSVPSLFPEKEEELPAPSVETPSPAESGSGPVKQPTTQRPPLRAEPGRARSRRMQYLSIAVSILLVVSFAWWLLPAANGNDHNVTTPLPPNPGIEADTLDKVDGVDSLGRDSSRF